MQVFLAMQTQWRCSMGGREGLIYSEAWKWMDEAGIRKPKKRMGLMRCLQTMENEALSAWAEKREQEEQKP